MKKFKVLIEREVIEQAYIEVYADTAEEAADAALVQSLNDDSIEFFLGDWMGDNQVGYVEEVQP